MPLQRSNTADKFIVDRRKPHRNSDVARAVRKTRDRLSQQAGNPDFDRELLKLHSSAMTSGAIAIPLLVLAIAAIGRLAGVGNEIIAWALFTLTCYTIVAFMARRIESTEASALNPLQTRREFLVSHFLCGVGWSWFVWLGCGTCQADQFQVVKAVVLLFAMAATAIMTSSLRGALLATFAVPVTLYVYSALQLGMPVAVIMAGLLVLSLPFFTFVARHLNRSSVMLLSFRSEKDALIAELDTAKSMSDEARRRAEDANLAKSRFLASMSHELRTPLNAILGFSEVMANEVLGPMSNPTYRDYANDVHDSGQHLLDLINEILDLSRIEAGRYQLNEEPVMLLNIVEDCCHMMELKARNKDIRVIQDFEHELPRLLADERAVRQITLNLLSNAIKFTATGGEIRVRVGWTAGGGQYISVRDNGPGIPEDEIPVVLSAFGQGSIAIKSAEQGTGLGLPIVQGLLAMHGGEFELHSKLREGTEAIAIFPLSRVMEELPALPTAAVAARRR
ncbi:HAMP domain-containing histidine kinase [Mesorhizobium sp. M00.F.Ca.ET.186.01.1.1]|nr:HAMP domain-containing histidine kinase [bacterium M00.F.Ca.ET.205.01.1.1]TGU53394.1 HAMP domain-containing histidine kinase [bacterium M00.F.Ca.ET.152.01.1.1]TGV36905.1 HAMP domain-containing histidine kinase [Mesorhizobium sp. M00.F.Ca.ET.186.01.1.1]TGZ41678.1 HAMP domain-containing histidine kinase [bacterium M00.F.Ca.ET.162.01.1.1]TIW60356.1 MAG: HAMP domain-containing histidine kinase [Mesorhizobium sp.]